MDRCQRQKVLYVRDRNSAWGHEVDHGYSFHLCDQVYVLTNVCMQYVYIAYPDPKASEQEEQRKATYRLVSLTPVKLQCLT